MSNSEQEFTDFIKSTIRGIKNGISEDDFYLSTPIKFKLAVTTIKEGGGGFKIYVVDAGGKYKAEEITKIEFEVDYNDGGVFACGSTIKKY